MEIRFCCLSYLRGGLGLHGAAGEGRRAHLYTAFLLSAEFDCQGFPVSRSTHVLSRDTTECRIVSTHLHERLSTADVSICCGATAGWLACQCDYCSRWQLPRYHQVDGLGGEACWQGHCFWNSLAITQWTWHCLELFSVSHSAAFLLS